MHPISTALFLVGYGLAIPIGLRLAAVGREQNRLALLGHQAGVLIALLAWLLRGSITLVIAHIIWLIGARIWFQLAAPDDD